MFLLTIFRSLDCFPEHLPQDLSACPKMAVIKLVISCRIRVLCCTLSRVINGFKKQKKIPECARMTRRWGEGIEAAPWWADNRRRSHSRSEPLRGVYTLVVRYSKLERSFTLHEPNKSVMFRRARSIMYCCQRIRIKVRGYSFS